MVRLIRLLSAVGLWCLCAAACAQNALSIRGSIVDSTGAVIPQAVVRVESRSGTALSSATSDGRGEFLLQNLPGGSVVVIVPASSGFGSRKIPMTLSGSVTGFKITLTTESISQEITVNPDEALTTDAAANKDAIVISADTLKKMPVFDQDPIAALTPFLDASSIASGGVTLIVDGMEVKSLGVSPSAIQEVRINNDPYSSEFSRPGRGRIDITTKPGSQEFHGEANFTFRDALFNAKNHFAIVRPQDARRIYEGHLTGPLGRGQHTNFLASFSRREQDTAVSVNAVTASGLVQGNVLTPRRNTQASFRATHDFSPEHRLHLVYTFEGGTTENGGVGGIVLPEAGFNSTSREDGLNLNDRIIFTPNLINQIQIRFEKDEDVSASVTNAQSLQVSGSFTGGGAQADSSRTENTVQITQVVSWSHKQHYIRFGIQVPQLSRRAVDDHTNRLGTFQFASLANFNSQTPFSYTAQQGSGRGLYWQDEVGAFVQDQIKLNAKAQLTLGVRYDWQTFLPDYNNFSPRMSFAYGPDKGKTILRVGAGLFYDRTGGDFPATVKLHDGVVLHSVQILNPAYPLQTGANLGAVPTNIVRFAPNVVAPYSVQYSVSVDRQVHKGATVTVGYRGSVQAKSFRSRDVNAPILPANPSLTANYARPNSSFGEIQEIESGGRALLNALDVGFRGQVGRVFAGQGQYTVARFENNTGGISQFPQDQYHPNAEWGRANQDQRQRFNLLGTINPDHWLSIGVGATLYSGTPYNETTGNDDFHTGLGNSRPAGVGRNTLQASGVASLDLLYDHDFKLGKKTADKAKVVSAGVSAFNVLNRTNYTSYIGTQSSLLFERPTAALSGRQIQFAMGYRF